MNQILAARIISWAAIVISIAAILLTVFQKEAVELILTLKQQERLEQRTVTEQKPESLSSSSPGYNEPGEETPNIEP